MANLEVKNLAKSYDGKNNVLKDISFSVKNGDFVSILGPSGCGKTTTLRIIAGLIDKTSGEINIDGTDISTVPVYKRNFGMVFQSFALFPHMTVFNNVAFGLKMRKLSKNEIKDRVDAMLELTGLTDFANQFPDNLSGGQQQRVSLARALVINPQLLLMDEPLSNLDAKLRLKMREEIRNLQQKMKMTVLFVTHDQQECFAISDKVLVMKEGRIEQYDTPQNIFHHPRTKYVAQFIGYENFINIDKKLDDHKSVSAGIQFDTADTDQDAVVMTIRPENIKVAEEGDDNLISGMIISREYLGQSFQYTVQTVLGNLKFEEAHRAMRDLNEQVTLSLPKEHLHLLSE